MSNKQTSEFVPSYKIQEWGGYPALMLFVVHMSNQNIKVTFKPDLTRDGLLMDKEINK